MQKDEALYLLKKKSITIKHIKARREVQTLLQLKNKNRFSNLSTTNWFRLSSTKVCVATWLIRVTCKYVTRDSNREP